MYDDTEADFWKEHFSRLLHKNMMSTDAQRITFDNCAGIIDGFKNRHPELKPDVNFYPTYATFEIFITDTVKLRIFIQNQVKCTLLQFDEGDYVKIVDAKFPYNPFMEIEEFLKQEEYEPCPMKDTLDKISNITGIEIPAEEYEELKEKMFPKQDDSSVLSDNQ